MVDRTHRELADVDVARVARAYHAWRGEKDAGKYSDIPGFSKSASTEEIGANSYILTPGRFVGAEQIEDEGESYAEKMKRLTMELETEFDRGAKLEKLIRQALRSFTIES